jgi:hypothetical protein
MRRQRTGGKHLAFASVHLLKKSDTTSDTIDDDDDDDDDDYSQWFRVASTVINVDVDVDDDR